MKLIILPHAGGASHAYQGLARTLPEETQPFFHDYPGHGRRSSESLLSRMNELVDDLLERAGHAGVFREGAAWAIFGHSMGALVAHGLIQKRTQDRDSLPVAFFASGARPPSWLTSPAPVPVQGTASPKPTSTLPRDLFWSKMAGYGGIPKELNDNPDIQDYFESLMRTDFSAIETHIPDITPVNVPIHVLYGTRDRQVVACLEEWNSVSASTTHFHSFDGSHFFMLEHLPHIGLIIKQTFAV